MHAPISPASSMDAMNCQSLPWKTLEDSRRRLSKTSTRSSISVTSSPRNRMTQRVHHSGTEQSETKTCHRASSRLRTNIALSSIHRSDCRRSEHEYRCTEALTLCEWATRSPTTTVRKAGTLSKLRLRVACDQDFDEQALIHVCTETEDFQRRFECLKVVASRVRGPQARTNLSKDCKLFSVIGEFSESLRRLHVDHGSLSKNILADISQILLKSINLRHVSLKSADIEASDVEKLSASRFRGLQSLNLANNLIEADGVHAIAACLLDNSTLLQSLNLSSNARIGEIGGFALGNALRSNKHLVWLGLNNARIWSTGALGLARGLISNTNLRSLYLNENAIGDLGACAFAELLANNVGLAVLSLAKNGIGDEGATRLAEGLLANLTLRTLDLSNNNIQSEGVSSIAKTLTSNSSLAHLNLNQNFAYNCGAVALADSLRLNSNLITLKLAGNCIGDQGASRLGVMLSSARCQLECLVLRNNEIESQGMVSLAEGLLVSSSLRQLDISANPFRAVGALAVARAVEQGARVLDVLIMSKTTCIGPGSGLFALYALSNPTFSALRFLNLDNCGMDESSAQHLSRGLSVNTRLLSLSLANNRIKTEGAIELAGALVRNSASALRYLRLSGNNIGWQGICAFAALLQSNNNLRELDLRLNGPSLDEGKQRMSNVLKNQCCALRVRVSLNSKRGFRKHDILELAMIKQRASVEVLAWLVCCDLSRQKPMRCNAATGKAAHLILQYLKEIWSQSGSNDFISEDTTM